jgi:hypothetical protein
MNITTENVFLRNKMKIGIIGISGKGKSTLLNHLINMEAASKLNGLIGPKNKEKVISGQTKNPVRYQISKEVNGCSVVVSKIIDDKCINTEIPLSDAAIYAKSTEKCTLTITVDPSVEFGMIMENYDLSDLEFIDTQGLLDTLDHDITVPLEIKQCSVLLYLYDEDDQGNRGDYIKKYQNFLNGISDKPLIFLETSTQWQIKKKNLDTLSQDAFAELEELDINYSTTEKRIRERYSILTGNNIYTNNDTFILSSVLSAAKSSVNYYDIILPKDAEEYKDECLRICAAHTLNEVFKRLNTLKDGILREFKKVNGVYDHKVGIKTCYDLLWDVFVKEWQRIDYNSQARVLRYGRNDYMRFKETLRAFHKGMLFNIDFTTKEFEIHTPYGYHCIYETYTNQDVLDCMQLLLDLYKSYLKNLSIGGNKLSKAVQVYLIRSVSDNRMCRDTGYEIPILDKETFSMCMDQLKNWISEIPVDLVVYKKFEDYDTKYRNKQSIEYEVSNYLGSMTSLISKLDYTCMVINNKMNNKAIESILKICG